MASLYDFGIEGEKVPLKSTDNRLKKLKLLFSNSTAFCISAIYVILFSEGVNSTGEAYE
jgi:hypothetical protein